MIKKKLIKNAKKIDKFLINFLKKQKSSLLVKPMKYGVISGGKKIRSTIIFDTGKIFGIKENTHQDLPNKIDNAPPKPCQLCHEYD